MLFRQKVHAAYAVSALTEKHVTWLRHWIDQDTNYDIYNQISNSPPPSDLIQELLPYRLKKPEILYRGLYFPSAEEYLEVSNKPTPDIPKIGEQFVLKDLGHPSAWTRDVKIAEQFARDADFGFVLKTVVQVRPDDTLVDTTELPKEICDQFRRACVEDEIILLPGERKVEVVKIFN